MNYSDKIYIAGHRGLIGSALVKQLQQAGFNNLVLRTHDELELTDQTAVNAFFQAEKPDYVVIAAAKVGGIHANNTYPAEFIYDNIMIQSNIIHSAWKHDVARLLFLGSSCIYPKLAKQPLREDYLLTGPLEATNRSYALAKIAGVEQCWSYNRQYATQFVGAMPTNLFGPGDNYDLATSHVIPALLRKIHHAHKSGAAQVEIWGTGTPRREFLYSEDAAAACVHILSLPAERFATLLGSDEYATGEFLPPLVNVGCGKDVTIRELAETIAEVVGFRGELYFNTDRPDGTPVKRLDTTRLTELGWTYQISLKEGLERVYREDHPQIDADIA